MELKGSEIIDIYIQGENIKSRDCFKFRICDGETSEKLTGCSHNPHARNMEIVFNYSFFSLSLIFIQWPSTGIVKFQWESAPGISKYRSSKEL